jgi:multiple sugar transport system substrate-binding protein
MKKVLLVLLTLMVAFSLTAITYAAPGKATLRLAWWGNPTRDARTLKVIEMYMAENPNVAIETETTGWAGYWDKLATQAAANNLPDIIQHSYTYLNQYVVKDLLLDLSPYVKSKKLDLSEVPENFISGGRVNQKIYGVSLGTNALCLIYDPAVLQQAGISAPKTAWTWADFEKIALEVHSKTGVQTLPFFTTDPKVGFENWIRQTGKPFYNKKGTELGFTDTKLLAEFFNLQLRLLKANALIKPDVAFVTTTPAEDQFSQKKSWVQFVWSNEVVARQAAANRPIGIALLPKITSSKRPGTFFMPSMYFTVAKSSAHKEEAVKFVNYFLNNFEVNKVLLAERGIPIVPQVRNTLKAMVDPVAKQSFEYIELVGNNNVSPIDPPDPPGAGEVLKIFRTFEQEVLYGTTSSKDAADKFIKQANAILAKNKVRK